MTADELTRRLDTETVEEPSSTERVLRRLPDPETAQRFVADRLDAYERMWDGCGCRVDYGD